LIGDRPVTWFEGRDLASAVAEASHLATVTSQAESDLIERLLLDSSEKTAWLGGIQIDENDEPGGGWAWVTGEPFEFTNWAPGEPNDTGGVEIFLELFTRSNGTTAWNDGNYPIANAIRPGYVVEVPTAAIDGTTTITDFTPGEDVLDLAAFGFERVEEVMPMLEGALDGTWLRFSEVGGPDVFLEDVLALDLAPADFHFFDDVFIA
jgi:hypothetical protein